MTAKILIQKPNVKDIESHFFGKAVRLSTWIDFINDDGVTEGKKELYFDFAREYAEFLDTERCDAFVIGLLSSAMEYGYNIKFEAPISKRLHYQLTNFYIPIIHHFNEKYPMHSISLNGPISDLKVTGCSGGVDSFYTITKYRNDDTSGYKLTHLICSSSGTLDHDIDRMEKSFKKIYEYVCKIGIDTGLKVIGCYNNLYEFYKYPYKAFNTFFTTTFCAVPFILDKLISVYYVNS